MWFPRLTWFDDDYDYYLSTVAAAQLSLVLQNLFVALCALAVCVHLSYIDQITPIWHGGLKQVSFAVIIVFAILADLSSTARMIAIERDWIVEICGNDVDRLAGEI